MGLSSQTYFPRNSDEITNFLNEIRVLEDLREDRLKAWVDIDPGPVFYATICEDRLELFRTDEFIRQADLLDELHEVKGLVVYPFDDSLVQIQ